MVLLYLIGHRSSAVRSYKRTSKKQEVMVSDVLYGCTPEQKVKKAKLEVEEKETKPVADEMKKNLALESLKGLININVNFL